MMHKDLFSDGISRIDPDAVERTLRFEQELAQRAVKRRRRRVLTVLAAALLTVMLTSVLLIVPFIPKTYDLNYEMPKHQSSGTTVRVYYANENGKLQSERVKMPDSAQNVFLTWQHLNEVDEQVQLLDYQITTEPMAGTTVVPDTLWEFVMQQMGKRDEQTIVIATLSPGITSYENQDALIESLKQTLAKYAGVSPEQIRILIDGEQIGIAGTLQFYHTLQDGNVIVTAGSTLEITVGMTNISDQNIEFTGSWSAFAPTAILTMGNTSLIVHEDYPMTEEYQKYTLAPGESREITYTFPIPEQAVRGEYDLLVTFGEQDFVFEKAVHVIGEYSSHIDAVSEFSEFLQMYGFATTDPAMFKQAVELLSYSGMSLFDLMTAIQADYAEGYSGEEYGSQWFSYGYTTLPNGKSNNYFVAKNIPDDIRLPCGITFADTLYHSLCKMGFTDFEAEEIIASLETGTEQQIYLGNHDLCVTRDESGNYVIRYAPLSVMSSSHPTYTLDIIYSRAEMIARLFLVKAGYDNFSTDAFTVPITVAPLAYENPDRELNDSDAQTLIDIFLSYNGTWKNGEVDAEYDYRITSKGMVFRYSTHAGVLADSGGYISLSNEHRQIVNEIVTKGNYQPNFQSIGLVEVPDGSSRSYSLPTLVAQALLNALNNAEWNDGSVDGVGTLRFDCDGTTVEYTDGIFFTAGHYCRVDSYTEDCTDALETAVIGMRSGEYNAILYYMGEYYGYSAAVNEKYSGTIHFSMNMNPHSLEELLCAYNTLAALGYIVDCSKADQGVLVTNTFMYFEKLTESKPDFSTGEVKLIETYPGLPPTCELTQEDAKTLREIFQRAEFTYCFGDDDAIYETTLEIGGYTIAYRPAWGDARIGNLKATLSEEDTKTVSRILGGYIPVE